MTLLIGSDSGLYRATELPFDDADRVLDCGPVNSIREFDSVSGIFVASNSGLYRSTDDGVSWKPIEVSNDEMWDVLALSDGTLFVGTDTSDLYRSDNGGRSWTVVDSFRAIHTRELWVSPINPYEARVRTLANPPGNHDRIVVGIEAGGLYMSDDAGDTWAELRSPALSRRSDTELQDDIHQIYTLGRDEWIVPTGRLDIQSDKRVGRRGDAGIFHTTDAGVTWTRLDRADRDLEHPYSREVILHDGLLCYCGSHTRPSYWRPANSAVSALFESRDYGQSWEEVSFPGAPEELIMAWCVHDDRIVGGAGTFKSLTEDEAHRPGSKDDVGRIYRRNESGEWTLVGEVPRNIHSLHALT